MGRPCMLPKGRKREVLITLHLEKILNLGGDCHPQEENEADEVQHLTGNNLTCCFALSMKVAYIKDKRICS